MALGLMTWLAWECRVDPRRREDGDAWLERHWTFLSEFATVVNDPAACTKNQRPPRPGDIVFLAPQFEPRVRLVVDVQKGGQRYCVTVVDEDVEIGERRFFADRVECLTPPGELVNGPWPGVSRRYEAIFA